MPNLLQDASSIEHRLLELAHTTDATLTAPALAYFAPCSIENAARVLEDLAARDRVSMDVEDDGTIVYRLRGRQRLAAVPRPPVAPLAPMLAPRSLAFAPPSPAIAAALTVVVPGAGHLYAGRVVSALLWFMVVGLGYALILPGLVLHLFSMVSAAGAAARLRPPAVQRFLPAARSV